MRIRRIEFSNINNLKGGPHAVSFVEEPLSSAGIFAITGPTGAGKSTLLDVITLALFNRIPRHGRVSKKAILDHGSVITHHSTSAYAMVEYEVNGLMYTSSWSVALARTGNLKDYEMSLSDASGQYLDINKSEVPDKNAAIIGLNYDQFVKSIILSQGEFAKFLKADKNERGEMLEKLTGTDIYRKLSVAAYDKYKNLAASLKQEEQVLEEIQLLSEEEVKQLDSEIIERDKILQSLEEKIKVLSQLLNIKTQLAEQSRKLELVKKEAEVNAVKKKELSSELKLLKRHDDIAPFRSDLIRYEQASNLVTSCSTFIAEQKKVIEFEQSRLELGFSSLEQLLGESVHRESYENQINQFVKTVEQLDYALNTLLEKGREERKAIDEKLQSVSLDLEANPEAALITLENNLLAWKVAIDQSEIDVHSDLSSIRASIKKEYADLNILKLLQRLGKEEKELQAEMAQMVNAIEKLTIQTQQNDKMVEQQQKLLNSLREQYQSLLKEREHLLKIANLEQLRMELVEGEPCPLCGAVDHPYSEHLDKETEKEIEDKLKLQIEKINESEAELKVLEKRLHQSSTELQNFQNQSATHSLRLQNLQREKELEISKLSNARDYQSIQIAEKENAIKSKEHALDSLDKWLSGQRLKKDLESLKDTLATYKNTQQKRKGIFEGNDVQKSTEDLRKVISSSQQKMKEVKALIADREVQREQARLNVKAIETALQKELEKRGLDKVSSLAELLLEPNRVEEIRRLDKKINDEALRLKTAMTTLEKDIEELNQKDARKEVPLLEISSQHKTAEADRTELIKSIAEKNALLKQDQIRRAQQQERKNKIVALKKEEEKWSLMNRLIGGAKGDKFANYAQALTLQNLLAHTNHRLADLTDRYLLNKPGPDGTLSIVDRYQGNIERAVTTLSGGEVFIISLALALSLSDMASKNIALESLFIDEGFGTLDQETLDVAMSTLEKLQSENRKMVGVISHVEALKERITTQIQLKKNAQGYSKIVVVS